MTLTLAAHVSTGVADSGMVLLDERAGRYWQLNGTAAEVATALLDGGTVATVTADLSARFPGSRARIENDVRCLVEKLRAAGLVS